MRLHSLQFTASLIPALAAVMAPGCGCGSAEEYPDPGSVFQATFNAPPGPGVSIHQAHGRAFGDNATCYLRLKASPPAFTSLTAAGFTPISPGDFKVRTQGGAISGPTPPWWDPMQDTPTVFLHSGRFHPGFSRGQAIVAYDPTSQIVNIYWDGMD